MSVYEFTIPETDQMADLAEYLNYLIVERCNEFDSKFIRPDAEYRALHQQIETCLRDLLLTPDSTEKETLTETLWIAIGTIELLIQHKIYRQGLKDGIRAMGFWGE